MRDDTATLTTFVTWVAVRSLPHRQPMGAQPTCTRSRTERFAWHYAFFARLASCKAPGSPAQLLHLTQAVHAFRGHLDPIRVADEVLLSWPFDVPEPGG